MKKISRRAIIAGFGAAAAGLGTLWARPWRWVSGDEGQESTDGNVAEPIAPEPSGLKAVLLRLVVVTAPWDAEQSSEFASRFLSEPLLNYFARFEPQAITLAPKLAGNTSKATTGKLQIHGLTSDEHQFLHAFMTSLFGNIEVDCALRNLPPPGTCLGSNTFHADEPA